MQIINLTDMRYRFVFISKITYQLNLASQTKLTSWFDTFIVKWTRVIIRDGNKIRTHLKPVKSAPFKTQMGGENEF